MTAPIISSLPQSGFTCQPGLYFKIILLFVLPFFCGMQLHAQSTAEEWIERAEEAAALGSLAESGSAYSSAGHKQMESGDYEAAAESFKKAAEQFKKDGRTAQAGTETTNAATAYEAAAERAARDGDHAKAAELYDKAAAQYEADERTAMADAAWRKAEHERTYPASVATTATGNTSGDIAEITITNHSNQPQNITIPSGIIPSDNNYQGYIIPQKTDVTVPSNSTHTVVVEGYCLDPKLPPPPPGSTLPPPNTWTPSSVKVTQVNEIISVVNRLVTTSLTTTPFGNDGNAGDLLTQYTVWSTLPDVPLTPAELCDEIIKTFVSISGTPVDALSPEAKTALDYSILQVKDAIDQIIDEVGIPAMTPVLPPAASQLKDAPPSTHPEITATIKPTGTGNTTGHVANLTMTNPTKNPVTVSFGDGPLYIPGEGGQPLAVPEIPAVPLAPGETKTVPVNGYCTDIRGATCTQRRRHATCF